MNLYPRNPRNSKRGRPQEACMAHRILDRLKTGAKAHQKIGDDLIDWALHQTGDAKPLDPAELAHCVRNERDMYDAMDDMGRLCDASRAPASTISAEAA